MSPPGSGGPIIAEIAGDRSPAARPARAAPDCWRSRRVRVARAAPRRRQLGRGDVTQLARPGPPHPEGPHLTRAESWIPNGVASSSRAAALPHTKTSPSLASLSGAASTREEPCRVAERRYRIRNHPPRWPPPSLVPLAVTPESSPSGPNPPPSARPCRSMPPRVASRLSTPRQRLPDLPSR